MGADNNPSRLSLTFEELFGPESAEQLIKADEELRRLLRQAREYDPPLPSDAEIKQAVLDAFPDYGPQRKTLKVLEEAGIKVTN